MDEYVQCLKSDANAYYVSTKNHIEKTWLCTPTNRKTLDNFI